MSRNLGSLLPGIKYGYQVYPQEILGGGGYGPMLKKNQKTWFVDGDVDGDGSGTSFDSPFLSIQSAIDTAGAGDTIFIAERTIGEYSTDPVSYAETLEIPVEKSQMSLIGVSRGLAQGGLPQIKIGGSSTTPMLKIQSMGCMVLNLGFNGASSTGGGILLDGDGSTKDASGTTIMGCHFKNCKGSTSKASSGGAISWPANGDSWGVRIAGNVFYKNVAGINCLGTTNTVPQDVIIEDNVFNSSVNTEVDADIYFAGSGVKGLTIRNNEFATVDVPALSSGTVARYISLAAGSYGIVAGNRFACISNVSATEKTFGAAGTAAVIPTTVRMADNYGEPSSDGINETGEIFRT